MGIWDNGGISMLKRSFDAKKLLFSSNADVRISNVVLPKLLKESNLPSSLIKCACLALYLFKNCTDTTTFKNNARLIATCNRDYRICIINELCISCHVKRVIRSLFDRACERLTASVISNVSP